MQQGFELRRRLALAAALATTPVLAAASAAASAPAQAGVLLRIPDPSSYSLHGSYFMDLLRLGWQKGAVGVPTELRIEAAAPGLPRERLRAMLEAGELDLLWSTSTPERQARFLSVGVNLLRGINDHRLLLVRRADLPRMREVRSLADLRQLRAGLGEHWSDAQIFRANGFSVVTATRYDALFRMLAAQRFDFIPCALVEADYILERFGDLDLALVPQLSIGYPQPMYFFIAPGRPELAVQLRRGLERAESDGSLLARYMAEPELRRASERLAALRGRRLELALSPALR